VTQDPGQWGQQGGYPSQGPGGYPPQQPGGYPPQQPGGSPPQQPGGSPPQQPEDFPPQQPSSYPPQPPGGYGPPGAPQRAYAPQPAPGGYPPQQPGGFGPQPPGAGPTGAPGAPPKKSPVIIIAIVAAAIVLLAAVGGIIMVLTRGGADQPEVTITPSQQPVPTEEPTAEPTPTDGPQPSPTETTQAPPGSAIDIGNGIELTPAAGWEVKKTGKNVAQLSDGESVFLGQSVQISPSTNPGQLCEAWHRDVAEGTSNGKFQEAKDVDLNTARLKGATCVAQVTVSGGQGTTKLYLFSLVSVRQSDGVTVLGTAYFTPDVNTDQLNKDFTSMVNSMLRTQAAGG
jgi:hypothetical protein